MAESLNQLKGLELSQKLSLSNRAYQEFTLLR